MNIGMTALRTLLSFTILTGIIYPLLITGMANLLWPFQASGSFIVQDNKIRGSLLIAQKFENDNYFWPRPSAVDYNAAASGASNLGPTSVDLKKNYEERLKAKATAEMLFASASGLDPHVSPQTARIQIDRVANARTLTDIERSDLIKLVEESIETPDLGFLGEPRVNILELNLKLDQRFSNR